MNNHTTWHNRSRACTIAAAVTAALFAAQASASTQLEEIVVTAQKREQKLLDVPVSVAAITGETLQNAGIESVAQLEFYAPSLVVAENSGGGMVATALVTRGIGVNGNIPYFEPSTALFIDGAYRSRSALGVGDLVAIDRIEYLRGPQSTLYGRNASAGVLSVYTPRPRSEWGGFVEATAGVEDVGEKPFGYLIKGDASGPVTDNVGLGASFTYASSDDLFEVTGNERINSVNGFDDYSLRGQVEWQATDTVNLRLSGGVVDRDHNGPATELFFAEDAFAGLFPLLEGINDGLRARQGGADLGEANALFDQLLAAGAVPTAPGVTVTPPHNSIWDRRIHMDGVKRDTLEGSDVIGDLSIDIGDSMVLNSITSYNEYSAFDRQDIDQLSMPIGQFEEFQDGDAFSQELRLSSTGSGPLEWIIGAFYLQDHLERQVEFQLGPNAILLGVGLNGDTGRFNGELDTTSFSIFGNVGYDFTDRLKLNAGLRWIDEKKDGEKINSSYNGTGPASPVFLNGGFAAIFEPTDSGKDELSTNDFTYSLSLQYDLTDELMLYGSHSRGFKSGGFNIVWGPIGPGEEGFEFDDETVYAYELGLKGTAADGTLQFSTAAFYQKHENYQTAAFIGTIFNLSNADQASTRGVEAELTWQALDSLRLGANIAFIDAKYDDFKNGPCNSLSTPDANGYCDQSGDQLPFVSDWTANLSAEYVQPLWSGNMRLRADLALADDYNPDLVLAPYYMQDGYERLNLRAGWESDNFDVTAFVNNVTDAEIVDWAGAANVVPGASGQFVIQAGRAYGLTLRLKF